MSSRDTNPYRGRTLIERVNDVAMTRDNRNYIKVADLEHGSSKTKFGTAVCQRFHAMVDEMEDK